MKFVPLSRQGVLLKSAQREPARQPRLVAVAVVGHWGNGDEHANELHLMVLDEGRKVDDVPDC